MNVSSTQRGGFLMAKPILFTVALGIFISAPQTAWSSDSSNVSTGPFVAVGAGTDVQLSGFDDGTYPSLHAGAGYKWSWIAVDVSFIWTTTEWHRDIALTDQYHMPLIGGWTFPGHMLGGIVCGRFYPVPQSYRMHPYLFAGVGAVATIIEDNMPSHLITFAKKSGSMWGLAFRGGVGIEIRVVWKVFIDLAVTYSYVHLLEEFDSTAPEYLHSPERLQSINVSGAARISF